jgi:transposase
MSPLSLTAAERRRLEVQLRSAPDAGQYQRTLALLQVAAGQPVAQVAQLLRVSRRSVYNWLDTYRGDRDPEALRDHRGGARTGLLTEHRQDVLRSALEDAPQAWDYHAADWTVPLLGEHLARRGGVRVADDTIRRQLHAWGYVWKRSRYELPGDPEREQKTPDPPAVAATAAAQRPAVRRRDGPAAVPAAPRRRGHPGRAGPRADQRGQRPAHRLRRSQHRHRLPAVDGPAEAAR